MTFDEFNKQFEEETKDKDVNLLQLKVIFWNGAIDAMLEEIKKEQRKFS